MNSVFPMIVGCGRSGTTLVRNILDAHPQLAVTHEAHFIAPLALRQDRFSSDGDFDTSTFVDQLYLDPNFRRQGIEEGALRSELRAYPPGDYVGAVRSVYSLYAAARGKSLYGDKTPGAVNHIAMLGSLFPEMRFIHMVRDGRAVALSYLERPEWGPNTIGAAAHHWRSRVGRGRSGGLSVGSDRYREVRYEDLVSSPETAVLELCDFLGIEFSDQMLRFHEGGGEFIASTKDPEAFANLSRPVTRGLRDWREQMTPGDTELFEAIAGDLLTEVGYETGIHSPTVRTRLRVLMAGASWQGKRVMSRVPSLRSAGRTREPAT